MANEKTTGEDALNADVLKRAAALFKEFGDRQSKNQERPIGNEEDPTVEMEAAIGVEDDLWELSAGQDDEADLKFADAEELNNEMSTEEIVLEEERASQENVDEILADINSGQQHNWDSDEIEASSDKDQYLDAVTYLSEEEEVLSESELALDNVDHLKNFKGDFSEFTSEELAAFEKEVPGLDLQEPGSEIESDRDEEQAASTSLDEIPEEQVRASAQEVDTQAPQQAEKTEAQLLQELEEEVMRDQTEKEREDPLRKLEADLLVLGDEDNRSIQEIDESRIFLTDRVRFQEGGKRNPDVPLSGTLEKRQKRLGKLQEGKASLENLRKDTRERVKFYQDILKDGGFSGEQTNRQFKGGLEKNKDQEVRLDRLIAAFEFRIELNQKYVKAMGQGIAAPELKDTQTKERSPSKKTPQSEGESRSRSGQRVTAGDSPNKGTGPQTTTAAEAKEQGVKKDKKVDLSLFGKRAKSAAEGAKAAPGMARKAMAKLGKLQGKGTKKQKDKKNGRTI